MAGDDWGPEGGWMEDAWMEGRATHRNKKEGTT